MTLHRFSALIALILPLWIGAQSLGGNSPYAFLDIPTSARSSALGGQGIALADGDFQLALQNPALVDSSQHHHLYLSYLNYFGTVNNAAIAFAHHLDSTKWNLTGGIRYMDYGKFDRLDATGVNLGNFYASDYVLNAGASYAIDSLWRCGGQANFIYNNITQYNSFAIALDAYALYQNPRRNITAAIGFSNLGSQLDGFTDVSDTLPLNVQISFTKTLKHAPLRFVVTADQLQQWDLTYNDPNTQETVDPITGEVSGGINFEFGDKLMRHLTLGAELLLSENFQFRFGYNYRRRQEMKVASRPGTAGISWGVGIRIKRFLVTYGRASYHLAGASNHLSVTTSISQKQK